MRHVAVVGAGIAGVCAADALVRAGWRVTLVAGHDPSATRLAALVNPFTGPNASPAWRHADALTALDVFLARLPAALVPGLVRPARDARQAAVFARRAAEHPSDLAWHDSSAPPHVAAPFGWLEVRVGGLWQNAASDLSRHLLHLEARGLRRIHGTVAHAAPAAEGVRLSFAPSDGGAPQAVDADYAVLACGASLPHLAPRIADRLHLVKGERFLAAHPHARRLPAVSAGAYAVPHGAHTVALGGTYDHAWTDLIPDEARGAALAERLRVVLPGMGALERGGAEAALRVQRPHVRRPLLGPLTEAGRLWAFGALGAKGLLHAPLLASWLPEGLVGPAGVPEEVRAGLE